MVVIRVLLGYYLISCLLFARLITYVLNSLSKDDKSKLIQGDNEPLGRLFQYHFKDCIKILNSMSNCSILEAEDVFMDALQVLRDKVLAGSFKHDNLRGFLLVTAKNKLLNKQKRDRKTLDLDVNLVEGYLQQRKGVHNPFDSSLTTEQERKVNYILKARNELGDSCQKLLYMNFDLGYKLKELVTLLGYNGYDSIKSTKSRCIATLRKNVQLLMNADQS